MRSLALFALIFVTFGCGDNKKGMIPVDSKLTDSNLLPPPDAFPSDLIATAKGTADGAGLSLPISHATVTYLKPQIGSTTNDPAGFTIQAQKTGPALFIAVDPATTTPALARGDVVSFTITELVTVGGQKRAAAISGLTRHSQGVDVTMLSQDVTAATDLVSAIDMYESELVDVTGSIGAFASSGSGFQKAQLTTTGITGNAMFVVRVPIALRDAIDMVDTCTVTLKDTPVGRFNAETQLAAFAASDVTLSNCPAPTVVGAIDTSSTSVRITFSRHISPGSVMADGSQFTFTNGLTATAATVNGRTVTVTTSTQAADTSYDVTVATTVTDLQGTPLAAAGVATFQGFETPAVVKVNEVNANITSGCDLIELRVMTGGTLRNIRVQERTGGAGELSQALPDVDVAANDIIVLHLASGSATCNPGTSTNETTAIDQNPVATFARNYDTAWDLFSADTGLTATDNVITVFNSLGDIIDAVLIDDDMAGSNVAAASETAAATVAAANHWQVVGGGVPANGFVDDDFRLNAVLNSATTGNSNTGDTLRRVDNTDDNDKADWAQGAHTWGLLNAGQ